MKIPNPELLWESKNKKWQIYLDDGKYTIDEVIPGLVLYPHSDSNGGVSFPSMFDIPKYVKDKYKKIIKNKSH